MGFREDLEGSVAARIASKRAERQRSSDFSKAWEAKRSDHLAQLLSIAAEVLGGHLELGDSKALPVNGGLKLGVDEISSIDKTFRYALIFQPDRDKCKIHCRTEPAGLLPEEPYDLDSLDESSLAAKIDKFVAAILEDRPTRARSNSYSVW